MKAIKENNISFDTIYNPENVSWFQELVSDSIVANKIKAVDGFFDNITIGQTATLNGTVSSKSLKSYNESMVSSSTYKRKITSNSIPIAFKWSDFEDELYRHFPPILRDEPIEETYSASGKLNGETIVSVTHIGGVTGDITDREIHYSDLYIPSGTQVGKVFNILSLTNNSQYERTYKFQSDYNAAYSLRIQTKVDSEITYTDDFSSTTTGFFEHIVRLKPGKTVSFHSNY